VRSLACGRYATFTPGPDGGGRYVFELLAPRRGGSRYSLRVAPVGADDIGVGIPLANLKTARGRLAPSGLDVVDLYHFDVADRSEVRLRLGKAKDKAFSMQLLTDTGEVLGTSDSEVDRRLDRGRYVVAVRGKVGSPPGAYALWLVVRRLTKTTVTVPDDEVVPGRPVTFTVTTDPNPSGGWTELQIDRFDPLSGWQFNRVIRVRAGVRTVIWTPPAAGRWRARAAFLGTLRFSPSRSAYVWLLVATPLPDAETIVAGFGDAARTPGTSAGAVVWRSRHAG
jgi:hypothetical protein